jgi:glycosyltransferase involved in cell wall biosynthesis
MMSTGARVLLTVSGSIPTDVHEAVAQRRRPRVDYLELSEAFGADLLDHPTAIAQHRIANRVLGRLLGPNAVLAWACYRRRRHYDVIVTDGEQIGLPLAVLSWWSRRRTAARHVMIVHIMSRTPKVRLFQLLRLRRHIDAFLVYSSAQQAFAIDRLGMPAERVTLTPFMVDTAFFDPAGTDVRPDGPLIAAAGLECRDYVTMLDAVAALEVPVVIAAASPWSKRTSGLDGLPLPANVTVVRLDLFQLRDLYARSTVVVMPLHEVDFQAGITTILEAMSMGKAMVCTRTTGQTDVIEEGVTGRYVPVGEAVDMRTAIQELLGDPERSAAFGRNAREWVRANADIDVYTANLGAVVDGVRTTRAVPRLPQRWTGWQPDNGSSPHG